MPTVVPRPQPTITTTGSCRKETLSDFPLGAVPTLSTEAVQANRLRRPLAWGGSVPSGSRLVKTNCGNRYKLEVLYATELLLNLSRQHWRTKSIEDSNSSISEANRTK